MDAMTKAADLYWKDMEILEEARSELFAFLDQVCELIATETAEGWANRGNPENSIDSWSNKASPGYMTWSLTAEEAKGFSVHVQDPRHSPDARFVVVKICVTKAVQDRLNKQHPKISEEVEQLSDQASTKFVWPELDESSQKKLHIYPDNRKRTATEVSKIVCEYLELIKSLTSGLEKDHKGK